MTPAQQKAQELIEKLLPEVRGADRYNYNLEDMNRYIAKQIAIICVDEILNGSKVLGTKAVARRKFWYEVKQELQKP